MQRVSKMMQRVSKMNQVSRYYGSAYVAPLGRAFLFNSVCVRTPANFVCAREQGIDLYQYKLKFFPTLSWHTGLVWHTSLKIFQNLHFFPQKKGLKSSPGGNYLYLQHATSTNRSTLYES